MSKYNNTRTIVDGIKFDSKAEARRYKELKLLEQAGYIADLQRQVKYELIPKQGGERSVNYYADFVYLEVKTGIKVVEDVKGHRTREYVIKRKLMRQVHGIEIVEVGP